MIKPDFARYIAPQKLGIARIVIQVALGIGFGFAANFFISVLTSHFSQIYEWARYNSFYIGTPVIIFTVLLVGATLFWVRGRYPMTYGATEVAIGIVASMNALARSDIKSITVRIDPTILIQILGGIYIIVRGLDNFGKGVKGTALENPWKRAFPQK